MLFYLSMCSKICCYWSGFRHYIYCCMLFYLIMFSKICCYWSGFRNGLCCYIFCFIFCFIYCHWFFNDLLQQVFDELGLLEQILLHLTLLSRATIPHLLLRHRLLDLLFLVMISTLHLLEDLVTHLLLLVRFAAVHPLDQLLLHLVMLHSDRDSDRDGDRDSHTYVTI